MVSGNSPADPSLEGGHPERVGAYRLLSVLGEGGMGVVYLAEQQQPVRREVALKVLKPGMDTRQVVARFEAERQALAVMEHPGIARVFDAGATEAGRPYFVMERVAGVPITNYCDEQRLGLSERMGLFAQVCRAVQHAHQKGVIHRDLKPSNVLVSETDGEPQCKIIDFGIAKAVERPADDQTQLTQLDQSPGTPAYMSPEQVEGAGRDIDTRSDIYSLGVLLYELLAGVLPFEPQAYRGWAFYGQHLVGEVLPPSARFASLEPDVRARIAGQRQTDPRILPRQLRGEPDWIVLRALERERERRYETANALALDLERYLANEPILASPPSRVYRARKFIRRHRVGVAFAAVLAFVLVGFAASMAVQADRIARARDLATARQAQAEDLIGFMVGDLRAKLAPVGRLDILDDVGQRALAYFAAVPEAELSNDELFRRAEAIRQLGEVRLDQGNAGSAMETFREALSLTQQLAARDPHNATWQLGMGTAHFWVGEVLRRQGDLERALHEFAVYRDVAQALVQRDSTNLEWQQELAYGYANVGAIAYSRRDLPTAVESFRRKVEVQRRLAAADTTAPDLLLQLADDHNFLGAALEESGDLRGAREQMAIDIALKRALVSRDPDNTRWRSRLGTSLSYLARNASILGMPDSALAFYREELTHLTALVERDPSNAAWRRNLAFSSSRVGRTLLDRGDVDEAEPLLRRALAITADLATGTQPQRSWRIDLAQRHRDVADLALARRRPAEALNATARSLAVLDSLLETTPDDPNLRRNTGLSQLTRGLAWAALNRPDSATASWSRAADSLEPLAAGSREWLVLDPYARTLLLLGRHDAADVVLRTLHGIGYRDRRFVQVVDEYRGHSVRAPQ